MGALPTYPYGDHTKSPISIYLLWAGVVPLVLLDNSAEPARATAELGQGLR